MAKSKKTKKQPNPSAAETANTESELTASVESTEGDSLTMGADFGAGDGAAPEAPEPKEKKTKKTERKIDFLFCSKCGFQTVELTTKSCATCKGKLEPSYSSNPQS